MEECFDGIRKYTMEEKQKVTLSQRCLKYVESIKPTEKNQVKYQTNLIMPKGKVGDNAVQI
jgi:hypothetical protein